MAASSVAAGETRTGEHQRRARTPVATPSASPSEAEREGAKREGRRIEDERCGRTYWTCEGGVRTGPGRALRRPHPRWLFSIANAKHTSCTCACRPQGRNIHGRVTVMDRCWMRGNSTQRHRSGRRSRPELPRPCHSLSESESGSASARSGRQTRAEALSRRRARVCRRQEGAGPAGEDQGGSRARGWQIR
ncbi:hypothetical protein GY45DRAFT_4170 [Cubamyces sp. BRFM 1775]|nr:hypothetical protein GY45DRAFT_4170 [Cubamyces sp. BRFM 1775]